MERIFEKHRLTIGRNESRTANTGLVSLLTRAVQCSADTFVVNQSLVLRINICGENRHLRKAAKPLWASLKLDIK